MLGYFGSWHFPGTWLPLVKQCSMSPISSFDAHCWSTYSNCVIVLLHNSLLQRYTESLMKSVSVFGNLNPLISSRECSMSVDGQVSVLNICTCLSGFLAMQYYIYLLLRTSYYQFAVIYSHSLCLLGFCLTHAICSAGCKNLLGQKLKKRKRCKREMPQWQKRTGLRLRRSPCSVWRQCLSACIGAFSFTTFQRLVLHFILQLVKRMNVWLGNGVSENQIDNGVHQHVIGPQMLTNNIVRMPVVSEASQDQQASHGIKRNTAAHYSPECVSSLNWYFCMMRSSNAYNPLRPKISNFVAFRFPKLECVEFLEYDSKYLDSVQNTEEGKLSIEEACSLFRPPLDRYEMFWEKSMDTKCLMAWSRNEIVIVFRGTASLANVVSDVQVRKISRLQPKRYYTNLKVHAFWKEARLISIWYCWRVEIMC